MRNSLFITFTSASIYTIFRDSLRTAGQLLVNPDELILGPEIDLDPAARTVADDADAGAEGEAQPVFRRARVDIDRPGLPCRGRRLTGVGNLLDQRLGLPHRQVLRDDVPRGAP